MPRQFIDRQFEFTQPDGTKIKVRGWGNQHHAIFEDDEGYTVVQDPVSGYFNYARTSDDGSHLEPTGAVVGRVAPDTLGVPKHARISEAAARDQARAAFAPGARRSRWEERIADRRRAVRAARASRSTLGAFAPPLITTLGTFKGGCVLVQFPDVPGTIERQKVDDFCNEQGYSGFGNNGSVRDYFHEVSNQKVEYTNIVPAYVTTSRPRAYYTNEQIPQGVRARELILEAIAQLEADGFDFSPLTADSGGYIRALNVFYAGPVVNNWAKGLWPHAWHLQTERPVANGSKHFFDYQFTAMGSELSLGTFCHENGHMICDFPDLYDYGYESNGVGDFCLMCAGGPDKNPTRVAAYLRRAAGWVDAVTPATPGTEYTLGSNGSDEIVIHRRSADEYFLMEHRVRAGRDQGLPDEGLAVWHVDELGSNNHEQGTETHHYECALEQADGKRDLENRVNQGDAGDLFGSPNVSAFGDASTPNSRWWNGAPSGLELVDIGAAEAGVSFKVVSSEAGGTTTGAGTAKESTPGLEIPDADAIGVSDVISLQGDGIVGELSLEVEIEHTYRGDLEVSLFAPSGAGAVVHDRVGGSKQDLKREWDAESSVPLQSLLGEAIAGDWKLVVRDRAPDDTGKLVRWKLTVEPAAGGPTLLEESPSKRIPSNDQAGITRTLKCEADGVLADLRVELDITHTWIGDLVVTLTSPSGNDALLHEREGGQRDNLRKTYAPADTPEVASLLGEGVKGDWKLRVQDLAAQDEGKLNYWSLLITTAVA